MIKIQTVTYPEFYRLESVKRHKAIGHEFRIGKNCEKRGWTLFKEEQGEDRIIYKFRNGHKLYHRWNT